MRKHCAIITIPMMQKLALLSCLLMRQSHALTQQLNQYSFQIEKSDRNLRTIHLNSNRLHVGCVSNDRRWRPTLIGLSKYHDYDRVSRSRLYSDVSAKIGDKSIPDNDETASSTVPSLNSSSSLHINALEIGEKEQYKKQKRKRMKMKLNRIKVSMAVSSLFTTFFLLIYVSGPGHWRYYLAGGICAAVSHSVTTPVDVIKTRKQLDDSMKDMNLIQSGLKIIKDDNEGGFNALLAGLGPTTIGYLFEGSVKFGVYEVLKPMVRSFLLWSVSVSKITWFDSKILGFVISGSLAGTAASIMLCPMEALRIRLVAEPEFAATGNWVDCGMKMINDEGLMGLWKCFPSMLFKQVPYTVTKNVSFDLITTSAYAAVLGCGRIICGRTKILIPLISAMIASILSCISSQPGDMLLSVINAHKGKMTTRDHVKGIMKENGVGGFFIGIQERFVHVGIIVTLQLLIYDFVKRLVGITATGL